MQQTILIFVFAFTLTATQIGIVASATAGAGACPAAGPCGGSASAIPSVAIQVSPTVCSGGMFTNPGSPCGDAMTGGGGPYTFFCRWNSDAARTMDATGGCIFQCNGGATTCKVGNDGLPVELIGFSAE